MAKFRTKSKLKTIIIFALIAILAVGLLVVGLKVFNLDPNKNVGSGSFSLGYLDSTGKYFSQDDNNKTTIVSDYIKIDDLKINVSDDNATADDGVEFKLYYYTENKTFVSSSSSFINVDYNSADDNSLSTDGANVTAKYIRIVARYSSQNEVSNSFAKISLANKLNVSVSK